MTFRILIVDDQEAVRDTYKMKLEFMLLGHDPGLDLEIDLASGGKEAIDLLVQQNKKKPYDFVILDQNMPGMDGIAVYTKILALCPQQAGRVVFCTGYADILEERQSALLKHSGRLVFNKPILKKQAEMFDALVLSYLNSYIHDSENK
ncbi:MAG: response regulator [Nanoarchaeota archaeon]|nr:response regulator [Nanoarchaeota archaeon]